MNRAFGEDFLGDHRDREIVPLLPVPNIRGIRARSDLAVGSRRKIDEVDEHQLARVVGSDDYIIELQVPMRYAALVQLRDGFDQPRKKRQRELLVAPVFGPRGQIACEILALDPFLNKNDGVAEPQHVPDCRASRRRRELQLQDSVEKVKNAGTLAVLVAPGLSLPHLHLDRGAVVLASPHLGDVARRNFLHGWVDTDELPLGADAAPEALETLDNLLGRRP
jgi:hypothetical protein